MPTPTHTKSPVSEDISSSGEHKDSADAPAVTPSSGPQHSTPKSTTKTSTAFGSAWEELRGNWRQPGLLGPIGELFAEAHLDGPSFEPFADDAFFLIKNQKPTAEDFAVKLLGGSGQRPSRSALAKEWKFGCGTCGATNTRLADLRRHIERHHLPPPAPDSPTEELSRSSAFLQAVLGPSERVIGTVRDQEWPQAVLPAGRRDTVAIATATPTTGVVQAHR
ncbi:hypothetical protein OC844_008064, partial [Tilletia horrida]